MTNDSGDAAVVNIRDVVPSVCEPALVVHSLEVPAGQSESVRQEYVIPKRGRFDFGPIWVRVTGTHQLVDVQHEVECEGSIRVLPETFAS